MCIYCGGTRSGFVCMGVLALVPRLGASSRVLLIAYIIHNNTWLHIIVATHVVANHSELV